eukprot:Phypoly_transcript_03432.p1 GENE.Phypoly_transcript_03432~~Phypoly_transcript_03432.p1  ORF type:complete len:688 (+),score=155.49 Phypoly_transcript_03432:186-2249(+)
MDLSKISAQVKGFQRRTTQKVLQQMGMADKTEDESQAYQNFLALGSFTSQLKTTIQAADTCFEKACTAQTHLAGQIQSYLSSELSGDADLPPGELHHYFSSSDTTRLHAKTLQDISGKFYGACSELGNNALQAVIGQLEDMVLRPITNDEEFGTLTKEILEEKKRATLDYDSYRRAAHSNNHHPADQDKVEAKLRAARDRHEQASKRFDEHIDVRNQIRCKLLVHGILTAMQQYCNYYNHAINIFRDTALSLKPLLEIYQMNDSQLQTALNLHEYTSEPNFKNLPKNAASVFDDYEAQQNNQKPRPSVAKTAAAAPPPRGTSPSIDDMMRNNTMNLAAKPAAQPLKNTPMNQYKNSPQASHVASPQPTHLASPQPTHTPHPRHQSPPVQHQIPPQQPPPQPPVDLFDAAPPPQTQQRVQSPPAPVAEVLVDLNPSSNDLLFGGSIGSNIAPPMQPANHDPFASFETPTPTFSANPQPPKPVQQPKPTPTPQTDDLLFPSPIAPSRGFTPPSQQPSQPQQNINDPFASFNSTPAANAPKKPLDDFDLFGPSPTAKPTTPTPTPTQQRPQANFGGAPPAAQNKQDGQTRDELNPAVTNRINNWASRGGRASNLRALLSTLHEVIWVDSGWDALSLADLVTTAQVKKAYHRANLIVHPDKVQNGTTEHQLIAQRIFEALRVSYETFKDEK